MMSLLSFKLVSSILMNTFALGFILNSVETPQILITVYTVNVSIEDAQFNLWKYAPGREDGNGLPSEGDFLISQGHANDSGMIIWDTGSVNLDLSLYGEGYYGINEVTKDSSSFTCNWDLWDEFTYYKSFKVSSPDSILELTCINTNIEISEEEVCEEESLIIKREEVDTKSLSDIDSVSECHQETVLREDRSNEIQETNVDLSVEEENQGNEKYLQISIEIVSVMLSIAILAFMIYASRKS